MSGPTSVVEVRYNLSTLKSPSAYVATITGWGSESLPRR
jgi:hypothetical protein